MVIVAAFSAVEISTLAGSSSGGTAATFGVPLSRGGVTARGGQPHAPGPAVGGRVHDRPRRRSTPTVGVAAGEGLPGRPATQPAASSGSRVAVPGPRRRPRPHRPARPPHRSSPPRPPPGAPAPALVPSTTGPAATTTTVPSTAPVSGSSFGSRLAGEPAVGVNVHTARSKVTAADLNSIYGQLAAAGVTWVRVDLGWDSLESPPGQLDPSYVQIADAAVDTAAAPTGCRYSPPC